MLVFLKLDIVYIPKINYCHINILFILGQHKTVIVQKNLKPGNRKEKSSFPDFPLSFPKPFTLPPINVGTVCVSNWAS